MNAERWLPGMLRALAIGLCMSPLAACTKCYQVPISKAAHTEAIATKNPEVVAELWKIASLESGSHDVPLGTCKRACGDEVVHCKFRVDIPESGLAQGQLDCVFGSEEQCSAKSWSIYGNSCPYGCGRLPDDVLVRLRDRHRDSFTRHFAEIAQLEALSVVAFDHLERDLARHRVSPAMRARVRRARDDEKNHTRRARAVLRACGARVEPIPRVPRRKRTLEEIARSNAVDGCIRETFGALLGCVQAERAHDPHARAFFRAIADDELAHANLAWDLHRTLSRRLSRAARARVAEAKRVALEELVAVVAPVDASLARRAGAPSAPERTELARRFAAALGDR